MKIASACTIFSLALFFFIIGIQAGPPCNKACTRELNPVCGRQRRPSGITTQCTFNNPCLLRVHICQTRESWTATAGACPKNSVDCERQVRG